MASSLITSPPVRLNPQLTTQLPMDSPAQAQAKPQTAPNHVPHKTIDSTRVSKMLAYVLRHEKQSPDSPTAILDQEGWVLVDPLLSRINSKFNPHNDPTIQPFTIDQLQALVAACPKQRYVLDVPTSPAKIRAAQGHSLSSVQQTLQKIDQPPQLYHGTADRFLESIAKGGLQKMSRNHVHLSHEVDTAKNVGSRHGKVVILKVDVEKYIKDGHELYLSDNNVYLAHHVPPEYLMTEDGQYLVPQQPSSPSLRAEEPQNDINLDHGCDSLDSV